MTDETGQPGDSPAEPSRPGAPEPRTDSLGVHLTLGFLGVALAAVALLTVLTVAFASADVSHLVTQQRTDLTNGIAAAAGAGWTQTTAGMAPTCRQRWTSPRARARKPRLSTGRARVASSPDFAAEAGSRSSAPM